MKVRKSDLFQKLCSKGKEGENLFSSFFSELPKLFLEYNSVSLSDVRDLILPLELKLGLCRVSEKEILEEFLKQKPQHQKEVFDLLSNWKEDKLTFMQVICLCEGFDDKALNFYTSRRRDYKSRVEEKLFKKEVLEILCEKPKLNKTLFKALLEAEPFVKHNPTTNFGYVVAFMQNRDCKIEDLVLVIRTISPKMNLHCQVLRHAYENESFDWEMIKYLLNLRPNLKDVLVGVCSRNPPPVDIIQNLVDLRANLLEEYNAKYCVSILCNDPNVNCASLQFIQNLDLPPQYLGDISPFFRVFCN